MLFNKIFIASVLMMNMLRIDAAEKTETYLLKVGDEAGKRLDVMDRLIGDDAREHLIKSGLAEGMTIFDVGCGNGTVSEWISMRVGSQGKLFCIDVSQKQLDCARSKMGNLSWVEFLKGDVREMKLPANTADIVYIRCVLMHVPDPLSILRVAHSILKPGGMLVCQEPITSSATSTDKNIIFQEINTCLLKIGSSLTVDYDIGTRLRSLVEGVHFTVVEEHLSQKEATADDMKALLLKGIPECAPAALKTGAADQETLDRWYQTIRDWPEDPSFRYVLPKSCHVTGRKE